jgi:hypothetical protein
MEKKMATGEVNVLSKCVDLIDLLADDGRRRCIIYLADKFGVFVTKCDAVKPSAFHSPAAECCLLAGHPGPHQGPGVQWYDVEDNRD